MGNLDMTEIFASIKRILNSIPVWTVLFIYTFLIYINQGEQSLELILVMFIITILHLVLTANNTKVGIALVVFFGILTIINYAYVTESTVSSTQSKPEKITQFVKLPIYGNVMISRNFSDEETSIIMITAPRYTNGREYIEILNAGAEDHIPKKGFPFCGMESTIHSLKTYDIRNFLGEALINYPDLCGKKKSTSVNDEVSNVPATLPYSDTLTLIRDLTSAAKDCFNAKVALTVLDVTQSITLEKASELQSIVLKCETAKLNNEVNSISK